MFICLRLSFISGINNMNLLCTAITIDKMKKTQRMNYDLHKWII